MKILITGSTGLLGQALVTRLAPHASVIGLSRRPPASGHEEAYHAVCDLTDPHATTHALQRVAPDVVIHTQAMSDVDRCEREPEEAQRMNVRTIDHLCEALRERAIPVFLLSTDYVFDGRQDRPYDEEDTPNPLSVYGRTKLAGERLALRASHTFIVRPSTLFGPGRDNFCETIVRRARQQEPVEAFIDQATSPTYTDDLADGIHRLIDAMAKAPHQAWPRVYHIANAGGCRRVEFAHRVVELLGCSASLVKPIRMAEQGRPATRPPFSMLRSRHLDALIGGGLRPWDEALQAYLRTFAGANVLD
ncbi:MAG: dTDP-4-dehydrorhamnose reductase [Candidatus Omnitrophica bacterium]|nr:dTDP-4-dehydrorhamnose reductase [Candidatus Omnitrophota bacterium]